MKAQTRTLHIEIPEARTQRSSASTFPPLGWVITTLGELVSVVRGVSYKKEHARYAPGKDHLPILRATNIGARLSFDDLVYVPQRYVSSEQELRIGDVVIAASSGSRSVVGKAAPLEQAWKGSFGAFCFGLRPREHADAGYIACFLRSSEYRRRVSELAAGVNINNLRASHIEQSPIPLAPLTEQQRIVAEVEKQFTRLDVSVEALRRARANLKRYRTSVLRAACAGRLVPTEAELARAEGRDYEPAEKLLQGILKERRAKWEVGELGKTAANGKAPKTDRWKTKYKEPVAPNASDLDKLPEGWCWATAEQCTSVITDGEHITPERAAKGVLLLSARNVRDGKLSLDNVDFVPEHVYERIAKRLVIMPGDVLLSCSGSVGRSCVSPPNLKFTLVRSVAVLKPVLEMGHYLSAALRSPILQAQIIDKKTQTAQSNIFQGKIKTLMFPLPPLAEQRRIVAEVERRLSVIEELEALVAANIKRAERLRQSILKRAFEGKLVPQDPSDEPASVLLERIRADRLAKAKSQMSRQGDRTKRKHTHRTPKINREKKGV